MKSISVGPEAVKSCTTAMHNTFNLSQKFITDTNCYAKIINLILKSKFKVKDHGMPHSLELIYPHAKHQKPTPKKKPT